MPFLVAFLVLRLIFWFIAFPNPDEAYYWLWGQHPDWSYYDHPPLQAWVQGAFTAVLGRSTVALRLPNLISNGIFFYTYYRITRYLYGKDAQRAFWLVVLWVLASPLYFLFLALAWHDHLLITLSLVASFLFITFLDGYLADGSGQSWRLYSAAIALGGAGLCKYNAVFVAIGFAATVLTEPRLRPLLRDRRLYCAIAIALCALIPIAIWNLSNDFQSFRYYVDRSVNTGSFRLKPESCLSFLLVSVLTVSPIICMGFFRSWKQWRGDRKAALNQSHPHSIYPTVALWVFLASTLILTAISIVSAALYYWNITAYLLLFPLLPALSRPSPSKPENSSSNVVRATQPSLVPAQLYGLFFATLLVIHYGFLPLSALGSKDADPDSRMLFGWQNVAAEVREQAAELDAPFLVTTDYRSASALAYQLNDKTVTAISDRVDQFDFWFNANAHRGKDAVILADDWHPLQSELVAQFDRTSEPTTVSVSRFGVWIKDYYVLKGYRFKGN